MEIYDRGWRLKALRKKRGLSQKAVADRLGGGPRRDQCV